MGIYARATFGARRRGVHGQPSKQEAASGQADRADEARLLVGRLANAAIQRLVRVRRPIHTIHRGEVGENHARPGIYTRNSRALQGNRPITIVDFVRISSQRGSEALSGKRVRASPKEEGTDNVYEERRKRAVET